MNANQRDRDTDASVVFEPTWPSVVTLSEGAN